MDLRQTTDLTKTCRITRIDHNGRTQVEDTLLREERWQLLCDHKFIWVHNCLPLHLQQMAVGQLRYRGLIKSAEEIASLQVDEERRQIRVERYHPSPRTAAKPEKEAEASFSVADIQRLQREFNENCGVFRLTGSAHSCALANQNGILLYFEDVARHNAMDKMLGEILLQKISADGKALFFSGRLALDIIEKVAASGVKVLVSPGAPTLTAAEAGEEQGLTLLGFVRADNINIYTHPQRISD